ncbi:MAG: hypothetical protein VKL59_20010 [Nostocaceae cyanobacterium]|nr:hypothetical protein [Nostocaceae cyanobacterium]
MVEGTQVQSFLDGFAVGELTGQLKHTEPAQIKKWMPLQKLKDFKGVLQKYNYSIVGIGSHPSQPDTVLMTAKKTSAGTNPKFIQAVARDNHFMDGWEAGCLAGLLRYKRPEMVEEWVRLRNLEALQQVIDEHGYMVLSVRVHPEDKRWMLLVAQRI